MVKADAYGHGADEAARVLDDLDGVWGMGVALVPEATALRDGGYTGRVLILGGLLPEEAEEAVSVGATVAISSLEVAEALDRVAARAGQSCPIHLKVDIGMHRLGIPIADAVAATDQLARLDALRLEGVLTHLAAAHHEDETSRQRTRDEIDRFAILVEELRDRHGPLLVHASNSSTLMAGPADPFDLARPGLALYGWSPANWLPDDIVLEPVAAVRARLAIVKVATDDALAGYSQTPVPAGRRLGVLPIGYGDGIPQAWGLTGGGVWFESGRAPMVGSVSMDSCIVDIHDLPEVGVGSTALVLGSGPEGMVAPAEMAAATGRNAYEVLTGLTARLPRHYLR